MFFARKLFHVIACCLLFVLPVIAHAEENPLVTQIIIRDKDSTYRHLYIYNDFDIKTLDTKYVMIGDNWVRREQTEWIFNGSQCTCQYFRKWINNDWKTVYRIDFEYLDGNIIGEIHTDLHKGVAVNVSKSVWNYKQNLLQAKTDYAWNGNAWTPTREANYLYGENNRLSTLNLKEFAPNVPVGESEIKFVYNEFAEVDSFITVEKQGLEWVRKSLTKICYDPVSKLKIAEFLKKWDDRYRVWKNVQSVEYKHNAAGQLFYENYRHWDGMFWTNDLLYEYRYNTDAALIKKITYLPKYDDYRPVSSVNYLDFQYGKASMIEANLEFWGGETGEPVNTFIPYQFNSETVVNRGSKIEISYIPIGDTGITTKIYYKNFNAIHIYPNPSKGVFYFDNEKNRVSSWSVSDLSGKRLIVKNQKEHSGVIDLSDFKAGVYLLQVNTPDGIKTQKLIKE